LRTNEHPDSAASDAVDTNICLRDQLMAGAYRKRLGRSCHGRSWRPVGPGRAACAVRPRAQTVRPLITWTSTSTTAMTNKM
jgi:hypothetical protein